MSLSLDIVNFNSGLSDFKDCINLKIRKADIYNVKTTKQLFRSFILAVSGIATKYQGQILLNNIDIQTNRDAAYFLQKHSLFITENPEFINFLTINQNLTNISRLWSGKNLINEAIQACNIKSPNPHLINLAKFILCPSYLWFLPKKILDNLPEENKTYIDNIQNIRIKQGGAIIVIDY